MGRPSGRENTTSCSCHSSPAEAVLGGDGPVGVLGPFALGFFLLGAAGGCPGREPRAFFLFERSDGGLYEEFQVNPGKPEQFIDTALQVVGDGADMLLLGPAMFSADGLTELKKRTLARLFPFSVSGEYTTLSHMDTATGRRDVRRLVELFTMLMRGGAEASITYAELDIARYLND